MPVHGHDFLTSLLLSSTILYDHVIYNSFGMIYCGLAFYSAHTTSITDIDTDIRRGSFFSWKNSMLSARIISFFLLFFKTSTSVPLHASRAYNNNNNKWTSTSKWICLNVSTSRRLQNVIRVKFGLKKIAFGFHDISSQRSYRTREEFIVCRRFHSVQIPAHIMDLRKSINRDYRIDSRSTCKCTITNWFLACHRVLV